MRTKVIMTICLFLLMEGARAGKNKSNGHA